MPREVIGKFSAFRASAARVLGKSACDFFFRAKAPPTICPRAAARAPAKAETLPPHALLKASPHAPRNGRANPASVRPRRFQRRAAQRGRQLYYKYLRRERVLELQEKSDAIAIDCCRNQPEIRCPLAAREALRFALTISYTRFCIGVCSKSVRVMDTSQCWRAFSSTPMTSHRSPPAENRTPSRLCSRWLRSEVLRLTL